MRPGLSENIGRNRYNSVVNCQHCSSNCRLLFNVENHITIESRSFDDVDNENDVPSRDFACDRVLDLTVIMVC